MPPSEAVQSAACEDPSDVHGGGGCEVVRSAQEHGAHLAENRAAADRRPATDPHPRTAARGFSPFTARAQATALSAGRVLLFPLPGAQDLGSPQGRLSAAHGEFG